MRPTALVEAKPCLSLGGMGRSSQVDKRLGRAGPEPLATRSLPGAAAAAAGRADGVGGPRAGLEAECARLLGEKSVLLTVLGVAPGQAACTLLVQEVPVSLRKEPQEKESHPRLHEKVAEYRKARWHQVAVEPAETPETE
ncbi:hypothetical protein HPG69_001704 [Diceros bicornis minor]|uniref:Uncharacterized protein n=1 Tax=Diceros bicornis minor TaxID=77932 RepID=A0A7J7FB77_DICBM|nr:hypothetical protein HPG69_001704 [Diceros bicornis minor]